MKGLVKFAPGVGNVQIRDIPEPVTGPTQVKIAVKAAGICGTDIHIYDDEYPSRPPVVLGHECTGQVVEIGSDVTEIGIGDRVTAHPFAVTCGRCRFCRQGELSYCRERLSFGSGVDGAFASYLVIPASIVRHLPENIDFDCGALTEPLASCVKAVNESTAIQAGDVVLVTGPGPIGLLASQLAKAQGATVITVGTAVDDRRLKLAQTLGVDYTFQVETDDISLAVDELTNGEGVDVVLECAGAPAAIRMGLQWVRKRGQITQIGLFGKPFELDYEQIALKGIRVAGSFGSSVSAWDRALTLLRTGMIQVAPLISTVLPLTEWEQGFSRMRQKEGLKVLLHPVD